MQGINITSQCILWLRGCDCRYTHLFRYKETLQQPKEMQAQTDFIIFSKNRVIFQRQHGQVDQGDDIFLKRASYVFESPTSFFKALN